jgi:hypothetical protein
MADILEMLIAERNRFDLAIAALQGRKRRGRPPGSGKKATQKRGRPKMSAAQRKATSARMKRYWAMQRKAANKSTGAKASKKVAKIAAA